MLLLVSRQPDLRAQLFLNCLLPSIMTLGIIAHFLDEETETSKVKKGWVWWLTPVIPALWKAKENEFETSLDNMVKPNP